MTQLRKQLVIVEQPTIRENQLVEEVALFNPDGTAYDGGSLLIAKAHLHADDIRVLYTDPFELVPSPGADKMIYPINALFETLLLVGGWVVPNLLINWESGEGPMAMAGPVITANDPENNHRVLLSTGQDSEESYVSLVNKALVLSTAASNDPIETGFIGSIEISNGGSGYEVGDTLTDTGIFAQTIVLTVASVDGSGAVTGITLTDPGTYQSANVENVGVFTEGVAPQPGIGTGFIFDVVTIAEPPQTDLYVTVQYRIIDLH